VKRRKKGRDNKGGSSQTNTARQNEHRAMELPAEAFIQHTLQMSCSHLLQNTNWVLSSAAQIRHSRGAVKLVLKAAEGPVEAWVQMTQRGSA